MRNTILIASAFIVVIINSFIGHDSGLNGILLTPIILIITTVLISFATKDLKALWITIITCIPVIINDILIKLYGGGSHDDQGQGLINLSLLVGLVPAFAILVITIIKNSQSQIMSKIGAVIIFPILISTYLHFFMNLGRDRHYPIENKKEEILDYKSN